MKQHTNNLIIGQGLAGTTLAWRLLEAGQHAVLIDRGDSSTASKVSAGLVTPWTGRRMTQSAGYAEEWAEAAAFYRTVEERLERSLFQQQPMVRIFINRSDEAVFEQRRAEHESSGLQPWSGALQKSRPEIAGCRMEPAGRLDVKTYLQASIDYFSQQGKWFESDLNLSDGIVLTEDGVEIPELKLSADHIIFCTGAATNSWFAGIPDNRSRGDVINVRIEDYLPTEVVHQSIWLAPEQDGTVTVGSTYDWKSLENEPTAAGRREILRALQRFIEGPVRVNRHTAAVRPTMKDYQPVVGRHTDHSQVFILNGLGSRGVLTAPRLARLLVETLTGDGDGDGVSSELGPGRLRPKDQRRSLTQLAQDHIAARIHLGDVVVDATVGNGFDTVFLAQQVGPAGTVYGFDIQQQAIQATHKRLDALDLQNVELQQTSHADVGQHVNQPIAAAMFNLGYLPRSDHTIVTHADTTISSLEQIQTQLRPGGIITVLAYRGHEGGPEEAAAVECWLEAQNSCTLERIDSQPPKATSPVLYVMCKQPE